MVPPVQVQPRGWLYTSKLALLATLLAVVAQEVHEKEVGSMYCPGEHAENVNEYPDKPRAVGTWVAPNKKTNSMEKEFMWRGGQL